MLQQFVGPSGKADLRNLLIEQSLLVGAEPAAEPLADVVEVTEYSKGKQIYAADESMNSVLYLLLGGRIDLDRGGSPVATLGRGQFFGEFPLLDRTARYTVSATAAENSVVASIEWSRFAELADSNPRIWRNLATELAFRLRGHSPPTTPATRRGRPSSFGEVFWPWVEGLRARWKLLLGLPFLLLIGLDYSWSALPDASRALLLSRVGLYPSSSLPSASSPSK